MQNTICLSVYKIKTIGKIQYRLKAEVILLKEFELQQREIEATNERAALYLRVSDY